MRVFLYAANHKDKLKKFRVVLYQQPHRTTTTVSYMQPQFFIGESSAVLVHGIKYTVNFVWQYAAPNPYNSGMPGRVIKEGT